jgi:hypothetical protein
VVVSISVGDRVRTVDYCRWLAMQLNSAAVWCGEVGLESESDLLNEAAIRAMAAVGMLSRPIIARPVAEAWQQAADGRQAG